MHRKSGIPEKVNSFLPLDKNNLGIDKAIKVWGPSVESKIERIRAKLDSADIPDNEKKEIADACQRTMDVALFPGYIEYYERLVERGECVFSHNDVQENNILVSLADNTHLIFIDYEYGDWNPLTFDLANYLNEYIVDNAYPKGTGIAYYHENAPESWEIEYLVH